MADRSVTRACVLIPAYQADKTLEGVITDLRAVLPELAESIIVIDDGSTDDTAAVALRLGCELISHKTNRGKGAAVRGCRRGGFDRDASLSHSNQPCQPINNADPPVGQGQQRHAAVGGDATAIEGLADFLARHAWQIEQKTGIVIHGGRGASGVWNSVGLSNQNLFQISWLRYVRQPTFRPSVNKTG